MSAVLIPRFGRLTLQSTIRWMPASSCVIIAKRSRSSVSPNQDPAADTSASTAAATAAAAVPSSAAPNGTPPNANSNETEDPLTTVDYRSSDTPADALPNSTKGRKIGRKSRRSLLVIPKAFMATNYLAHASIQPEPLCPIYADALPSYLWNELRLSVRAGLAPKGTLAALNHSDHIVLNVTGRGATYMQDKMARQIAAEVGADLMIFDPQDFIALAQEGYGNVVTLLPVMSGADSSSSALLAIRSAILSTKNESSGNDTEHDLGEIKVDNNSEVDSESNGQTDTSSEKLQYYMKEAQKLAPKAVAEMTTRYTSLFERMLLQIPDSKDKTSIANATVMTSQPKLVYLRDYGDMHDVLSSLMLKSLMTAIEHLRQKGHPIVVMAGYSPPLTRKHPNYKLSLDENEIPMTTGMKCITIPPPVHDVTLLRSWEAQLEKDTAKRIGEVNARQIIANLNQKQVIGLAMLPGTVPQQVAGLASLEGIQDSLWNAQEVDRHVTTALGHALSQGKNKIDFEDFVVANQIVRQSLVSRRAADRWLEREKIPVGKAGEVDLSLVKRQCDEYELRLLSRIVDPSKVQCTFKDIRAPRVTIETLQTLITLPLVRPDLFQKGILKRNFISGVLLFGPPGTGKTMLAKAVAKESGSRMLEIQASDIYEMYLGEGEKNVKAMFSLARKLSPCVVFIDEVDSLLNRRRSDSTSNAHREIINQFMVEWDGLSSDNQGVIVMAATNRPFDLDDAALRRMPRRILVDLPTEEDRIEILKMLLQEEEHEVSVAELARRTELYSGSDLKNLCVTAALRAVQQEASSNSKRILRKAHFDEALKMIPASCSEDMDSLVEIRKWAAKYGDGGTKRKKHAIGFS